MNLDFNDVVTTMQNAGLAHMGLGTAQGKDKAEVAAKAAISSPLLETSITGSRGIIINFTSSPDIGLDEIEFAASLVGQEAHPDANIIWGVSFDSDLEDEMRVTVIATGFEADKSGMKTVARPVVDADVDNSDNDFVTVDDAPAKSTSDFDDVIGMLGKNRRRSF
jgi:cell division protein FtsZ